jgi:hypothetical protein
MFRLLAQHKIDATFLRKQSATKLVDHLDGWKSLSDKLATIHVRSEAAVHAREPLIAATIR